MTSPTSVSSARKYAAALGLSERSFISPSERAFVTTIERGMAEVEAGLLEKLQFGDDLADTAARYLAQAGGKRVRPALALLTAQLGKGTTPSVVTAAQALEITHLATLYHDDVMDEAPKRRGVTSAQGIWGNNVAILTGDLLFARASSLIAGLGGPALRLQADTFERLVLGQLHETIGPKDGDDPIAHYIQVLADKTGSLIAAAAQFGIVFGEAPEEYEEAVVTYGERIGIAFQLVDDVIDLSPRLIETGKTPGTDLLAGVATLPSLKLAELAKTDPAAARLKARIDRDVDADASAEERQDLQDAVTELHAHPVTAETLAEAHRWADEAVAALAPLPKGPVRKAMTRFAETIVERSS